VTPGFAVSLGVKMTYLFPRIMGNFLSDKAAEARAETRH
jgi:hypothetical protein